MMQAITPNPNIPCKPGWCLAYVNEAFGVPKRFGSASAAWFGSSTQHHDRNFPPGVWLPVWYGIVGEPLGHVVLMAPDGSCYSTSDLSNKPYHHPNLAHLEWFYAYYGMTLTYRGWTEDVEGTPVITPESSISYASESITPIPEDDMFTEQDRAVQESILAAIISGGTDEKVSVLAYLKDIAGKLADIKWDENTQTSQAQQIANIQVSANAILEAVEKLGK